MTDKTASVIIEALNSGRAVETVPIELNGEGSGEWEVTINVAQVIALVKHPSLEVATKSPAPTLRLLAQT